MNIHMDNNVSIPFDENQTSSVKKSALKGATLHSDGSFPVKAKGAGAPVKKKRKALGDVSQSQINARQKSSGGLDGVKSSKLHISVDKATPKQLSSQSSSIEELSNDDMICSGIPSKKKDIFQDISAKKIPTSIPATSHPLKNIGLDVTTIPPPSCSSEAKIKEQAMHIVNELSLSELLARKEESDPSSSFLSDVAFDNETIDDLLSD